MRLVRTGQRYDERMSGDFFRQLGIADPDIDLEVGTGERIVAGSEPLLAA